MLKKLIQPMKKECGPRLCLDQDDSTTQKTGRAERLTVPATTDQDTFEQMIAELRLALVAPGTE